MKKTKLQPYLEFHEHLIEKAMAFMPDPRPQIVRHTISLSQEQHGIGKEPDGIRVEFKVVTDKDTGVSTWVHTRNYKVVERDNPLRIVRPLPAFVVSPHAEKYAKEKDLDLDELRKGGLKGTGDGGRLLKSDVQAFMEKN